MLKNYHNCLKLSLSLLASGVAISTDIIAGFCDEREEDHNETLSLMERVKYDMAYMFAYSMRKVKIKYH